MNDYNYKLTEIVKGTCKFEYYRMHHIYYTCIYQGERYLFPIDIEDVGGGTLENEMKALTLMRWIRKSIGDGSFVKYEQ